MTRHATMRLLQRRLMPRPMSAEASSQACRQADQIIITLSRYPHLIKKCCFSSWSGRGQDMLSDAFLTGGRPKVLLEAMAPSGFDVSNLLKKVDPNEVAPHGALHMMGSILAFPNSCFLWNVEDPKDITAESLAPVLLHRPKIEFLFIGTAQPMDPTVLNKVRDDMKEKGNVVVEWLPLSEAMATFNIMNGEDRMVATALILDKDESHYNEQPGGKDSR